MKSIWSDYLDDSHITTEPLKMWMNELEAKGLPPMRAIALFYSMYTTDYFHTVLYSLLLQTDVRKFTAWFMSNPGINHLRADDKDNEQKKWEHRLSLSIFHELIRRIIENQNPRRGSLPHGLCPRSRSLPAARPRPPRA